MNIERLKVLVLGILDTDEAVEAMRILSDSKSYGDLQLQVATLMNQLADAKQESVSLKKQLEEEKHDHAQMENALARARIKAENEARELRQAAKVKPESQIQAELLADMHRCNVIRAGTFSDVKLVQEAIRNAINAAAIRFQVLNQTQAILEKK